MGIATASWRVQTRHPRLASLQRGKAVDAGLRRHDGEELTEESIFPTADITLGDLGRLEV